MSPLLVLTNHLGFELGRPATALVQGPAPLPAAPFHLRDSGGRVVARGALEPLPPVPGWKGRHHARADLGTLSEPGALVLEVDTPGGPLRSQPLAVAADLLHAETTAAVLGHVRAMRCREPWDGADRQARFFGGRPDRVDVHGGYHDASGDVSKYLSHLSYANFMNPQQSPLLTWALLEVRARAHDGDRIGDLAALGAEAAHGADFLVRMQDPAGYFYMTVFDRWTKRLEEREICSYRTQQGIKLEKCQAGYRQGGGLAIAALARAGAAGLGGDFPAAEYLARAARGFAHLEAHNRAYLDDGRENIIDDYCALLAAAELFAATAEARYRQAGAARAQALVGRVGRHGAHDGVLRADDGERPFFHAVEAGLPAVALLRWLAVGGPDAAEERAIEEALGRMLAAELSVTGETSNPFGYARQVVKPVDGPVRTAFFFPHQNESGYWWQGENARLASLAAAARGYVRRVGDDGTFGRRLLTYAQDQLDWILGRNPFDACMLHGFGRNNVEYSTDWRNLEGGICNGITAGFHDEEEVEFLRTDLPGDQTWRWSEQWLPHAAWYLLAVAA